MYYHENRCVEVARAAGHPRDAGLQLFRQQRRRGAARGGAGRCDWLLTATVYRLPSHPIRPIPCRPKTCGAARSWPQMGAASHDPYRRDAGRGAYRARKIRATPVEHLDALGMLDDKHHRRTLHLCHRQRHPHAGQRRVAVSHNPQSNMKISSGVAPVEKMRAAGALVTIGTDGTCSNNDLDMFEELRTAGLPAKIRHGRSRGAPGLRGAEAGYGQRRPRHGLRGGELGVIRPGALADLIVVDLQKPHLQPIHDWSRTWSIAARRRMSTRWWSTAASWSKTAVWRAWTCLRSMPQSPPP